MFSITDTRVAFEGRTFLSHTEADAFLRHGLTRSYRKRGVPEKLLDETLMHGHADVTWRFRHRLQHHSDLTFDLHLSKQASGFEIICSGEMASWALGRVNLALGFRQTPVKRVRELRNHEKWCWATESKRRKRKEKQDVLPRVRQEKKKRNVKIPAPFTLEVNQKKNVNKPLVIRQQFKKQRITWHEMIKAVLYIFEVRGNWKYTARQLVGREIWKSFEASGRRFVQYKRSGFTLRFDLIDGVWRGDITPLTIAATKNNKDPRYRRMRAYFGSTLEVASASERRKKEINLFFPKLRFLA